MRTPSPRLRANMPRPRLAARARAVSASYVRRIRAASIWWCWRSFRGQGVANCRATSQARAVPLVLTSKSRRNRGSKYGVIRQDFFQEHIAGLGCVRLAAEAGKEIDDFP